MSKVVELDRLKRECKHYIPAKCLDLKCSTCVFRIKNPNLNKIKKIEGDV